MGIKQALALLFVLVASAVSADTLLMRSGKTYEGKLIGRHGNNIIFKTVEGGTMTVVDAFVASVETDEERASSGGGKGVSGNDGNKAAEQKVPLPSQAEIAEATKRIKDLFKNDYSKKGTDSRKALAGKFLRQTETDTSSDAATKYALLTEAANLAADAGDVGTLTDACSRIGAQFEGDTLLFRGGVLIRAARNTTESADQSAIAESYIDLSTEALAAENLNVAKRAADAANACAGKAQNAGVIRRAKQQAALVTEAKSAFDLAASARATLKTNANDAAANLALGRWLCFYKNDWAGGIPLLAKSGDPALAAAADSDKEAPSEAKAQVAVGDTWFALGEKETSGHIKACLWSRAKHWYSKSVGILGGILAERTKKRIAQIDKLGAAVPGAQKAITLNLGGGVTMKLVRIPAGKFLMGSPAGEVGRQPNEVQHEVTITKPFHMGQTPVTVDQFAAFVKDSGYKTDAENDGWSFNMEILDGQLAPKKVAGASWSNPGFAQKGNHPVVHVTWNDAKAFCDWLSTKSGKTVQLPTEAQWEYACRAGSTTANVWGDKSDDGKGWGNCADQTLKKALPNAPGDFFNWDDGFVFTSPVGSFKPNGFGLYDMAGNVTQWCRDWYGEYRPGAATDPTGPRITASKALLRGGSWGDGPFYCRSARRHNDTPVARYIIYGFRVIVSDTDVE